MCHANPKQRKLPNKTTLFTNEKKDFFFTAEFSPLFDHKFLVFHSFESYISVVGQGPWLLASKGLPPDSGGPCNFVYFDNRCLLLLLTLIVGHMTFVF